MGRRSCLFPRSGVFSRRSGCGFQPDIGYPPLVKFYLPTFVMSGSEAEPDLQRLPVTTSTVGMGLVPIRNNKRRPGGQIPRTVPRGGCAPWMPAQSRFVPLGRGRSLGTTLMRAVSARVTTGGHPYDSDFVSSNMTPSLRSIPTVRMGLWSIRNDNGRPGGQFPRSVPWGGCAPWMPAQSSRY